MKTVSGRLNKRSTSVDSALYSHCSSQTQSSSTARAVPPRLEHLCADSTIRSRLQGAIAGNKMDAVQEIVEDLLRRNESLLTMHDIVANKQNYKKERPGDLSFMKQSEDSVMQSDDSYVFPISKFSHGHMTFLPEGAELNDSKKSKVMRPKSPTRRGVSMLTDKAQFTYALMESSVSDRDIEKIFNVQHHEVVCGVGSKALISDPRDKVVAALDVGYFWCNFCPFTSNNKSAIVLHVTDHRFACKYCPYESFCRSDIMRHMVKKHDEFSNCVNNFYYCTFLSDYLKMKTRVEEKENNRPFKDPDDDGEDITPSALDDMSKRKRNHDEDSDSLSTPVMKNARMSDCSDSSQQNNISCLEEYGGKSTKKTNPRHYRQSSDYNLYELAMDETESQPTSDPDKDKDPQIAIIKSNIRNLEKSKSTISSSHSKQAKQILAPNINTVCNSQPAQSTVHNSEGQESKVHSSEGLESNVHNADNFGYKVHKSQGLVESKVHNVEILESKVHDAEMLVSKGNYAQGKGSKVHTAEGLKSKIYHAEKNLGSKVHHAENLGSNVHNARGVGSKVKNTGGLQSKVLSAQGIESKVHSAQGIESKVRSAQGMESKVHSAQGIESKVHSAQGIESKVHSAQGIQSKVHSAQDIESNLSWSCGYCHFQSPSQREVQEHSGQAHKGQPLRYVALVKNMVSRNSQNSTSSQSKGMRINEDRDKRHVGSSRKTRPSTTSKSKRGIQALRCYHCPYTAKRPSTMKTHLYYKHRGESLLAVDAASNSDLVTFFCAREDCTFKSQRIPLYMRHIEQCTPWPMPGQTHSDRDPLVCQSMEKTLHYAQSASRHQLPVLSVSRCGGGEDQTSGDQRDADIPARSNTDTQAWSNPDLIDCSGDMPSAAEGKGCPNENVHFRYESGVPNECKDIECLKGSNDSENAHCDMFEVTESGRGNQYLTGLVPHSSEKLGSIGAVNVDNGSGKKNKNTKISLAESAVHVNPECNEKEGITDDNRIELIKTSSVEIAKQEEESEGSAIIKLSHSQESFDQHHVIEEDFAGLDDNEEDNDDLNSSIRSNDTFIPVGELNTMTESLEDVDSIFISEEEPRETHDAVQEMSEDSSTKTHRYNNIQHEWNGNNLEKVSNKQGEESHGSDLQLKSTFSGVSYLASKEENLKKVENGSKTLGKDNRGTLSVPGRGESVSEEEHNQEQSGEVEASSHIEDVPNPDTVDPPWLKDLIDSSGDSDSEESPSSPRKTPVPASAAHQSSTSLGGRKSQTPGQSHSSRDSVKTNEPPQIRSNPQNTGLDQSSYTPTHKTTPHVSVSSTGRGINEKGAYGTKAKTNKMEVNRKPDPVVPSERPAKFSSSPNSKRPAKFSSSPNTDKSKLLLSVVPARSAAMKALTKMKPSLDVTEDIESKDPSFVAKKPAHKMSSKSKTGVSRIRNTKRSAAKNSLGLSSSQYKCKYCEEFDQCTLREIKSHVLRTHSGLPPLIVDMHRQGGGPRHPVYICPHTGCFQLLDTVAEFQTHRDSTHDLARPLVQNSPRSAPRHSRPTKKEANSVSSETIYSGPVPCVVPSETLRTCHVELSAVDAPGKPLKASRKETKRYQCLYCTNFVFDDSLSSVKAHYAKEHESQLMVMRDTEARRAQQQSRIYVCEHRSCDFFSFQPSELSEHAKSHVKSSVTYVYECAGCGWYSSSHSAAMQHVKTFHALEDSVTLVQMAVSLDDNGQTSRKVVH